MNYAWLTGTSIVDGEGLRASLFVSGCRRHCNGCFNKQAWDFNYGAEFTQDTLKELVRLVSQKQMSGITILGGEPFEPENLQGVHDICKAVRKIPKRTIWIYTGYTLEELQERNDPIIDDVLALTDVLVDGPFVEDLKDINLKFRGSSNQRIIDMYRTNLAGKLMLWEEKETWL